MTAVERAAGLHAAWLVAGALLYVLLLRWGVWRWLAALATVPALLGAGLAEQAGTFGLLVSGALLAACWRARPSLARAVVALGCLVAAATVTAGAGSGARVGPVRLAVLVAMLLVWFGAVLGLGRARAVPPVRAVCAVTALLPLAVAAATRQDGGAPWPALSSAALVWWPPACMLGLTALLRGRRSPAAGASRLDAVDSAAMAAFDHRYGAPRLAPVAVVIAAYNERNGLPGVLAGMPETVCGLPVDVLVVDDGSTDGTAAAVGGDARAYVVPCPVNRGQGAALRLGYAVARRHAAHYVVTTDADGQYDTGDLPVVLAPVLEGRADFVTGSRRLGRQPAHDRVRRLGVHVFAWLVSALVGKHLTDTSFGLRAMRAGVTGAVTLSQPQYQSSELLIGVLSHGFRVLEVPGTMHLRAAGSTKKGPNLVYGARYAKVVLGTWWREGCPSPLAEHAAALRESDG